MDNISRKIAFLEKKLKLLEYEKKLILKEIKDCKKVCTHDYLIGGINIIDDDMYYCLSCGEKVLKSSIDGKTMIDIKDYLTKEEYESFKFADIFNECYDLANKRLNEMLLDGIPSELIEAVLITELVNYLEEYRKEKRGR